MSNQRCAVVLWSAAQTEKADLATPHGLPDWATAVTDGGKPYPSPDAALAAALKSAPPGGQDVLLLEAGVELPPMALQRLYQCAERWPDHSQLISAVHPSWLTCSWPPLAADSALWWALPRQVFPHQQINPSCSLWLNLAADSIRAGLSFQPAVCSHLLVGNNPQKPAKKDPDPHDRPAASLLDKLASQLHQITDACPAQPLPLAGLSQRPVLLHVLHSWGGGTARWVDDTASAWTEADHLFLLSAANPTADSHGQELQLYAGSMAGPCLRRWALPAPIVASAGDHPGYQAVLQEVISDHGVSALLVSSIIGHSVEALQTSLPTLCMLHDYYPAWPDLGVLFESPSADCSDQALDAALAQSPFKGASAEQWLKVRALWLAALNRPQVTVLAPSASVAENLRRILGSQTLPPIKTIAHGIAPFAAPRTAPRRSSGKRWRLLIPGRISKLKGADLLRQALPEITQSADVYLLGGGKHAEAFFGCNHVHIMVQYQRSQLPDLINEIQPDLALLLSCVSETFNYTLSEMWALKVPVLATRVGALAERISHGSTGLLIEPSAEALVNAVAELNRQQLTELADSDKPLLTPRQAVVEYQRAFELEQGLAMRYPISLPSSADLAAADGARRLQEAEQRAKALAQKTQDQQKELEQRASWARSESQRADKNVLWAQSLERQVDETGQALQTLNEEFEDRSRWALELNEANQQYRQHIGELSGQLLENTHELEMVLNTRSWKLTRPLRVAARLLRRCLTVIGLQRRRASSLSERTRKSLRMRGVRGTIDRISQELKRGEPDLEPAPLAHIDPDAPFEALSFERPAEPVVSIIIPTYNHYNHTQACLKSLTTHQTDIAFEVIVVDDCSSDESRQRLAEHSGLQVVHNEQNQGFIDTCNAGAQRASGQFLFFLNNDTVVADQCLDQLVKTFADHPDCGLAGAKLVYPDGRLQEAGGIVFSDGSGWNFGRFENPAAPEVNFVREVDYCSGAAILIRRQLFDQLGGFDQRYRPAYYEDTDLAFQVRENGLKVMYQPAAQVVHFEGITSGTDTASGVKRYQVVNQEKFVQRWESALKRQPDPADALDLSRRHRRRRSVLIIDACTPTPDQDSGSVRMVNLMKLLLDLGWHVRFMAENRSFDKPYTNNLQQLGVEVLYHPFVRSAHSYLKTVGSQLDAVILSRHYIASNHIDSVRSFCPNAQLIFDTVDLHYLREQRLAELEGDEALAQTASKTRARELDVARRCDLTLVVSEFERNFLAQDAADLKVSVLSNIHPVHGCRRGFDERSGLLFVGGFQHPPNVDGITWFVTEVLPLVRNTLPDIVLTVIGSKITDAVRSLDGDGVNVLGFVEDIEPYLDGARLSLAPLRYGAGVKGKINMAMSYGQPVVATGPAVEGMFVKAGKDVMVGDTPQQFADGVIQAYTDQQLWQTLSEGGLKNVQQHFSEAAARRALSGILDQAG